MTGIIGRLLDLWQAHEIAAEANSNGVGIPQAVEERLLELQLTVERLSAGKSAAFKRYCMQVLSNNGSLPDWLPMLAPHEQIDFRRVYDVLMLRISLVRSPEAFALAHSSMALHPYSSCLPVTGSDWLS